MVLRFISLLILLASTSSQAEERLSYDDVVSRLTGMGAASPESLDLVGGLLSQHVLRNSSDQDKNG